VLEELAKTHDFSQLRMLHFAPEPSVRKLYRQRFAEYHTADIEARGVDFQADMRRLPFEDRSYDVVLASHVLEHIAEDESAIAEIARVVRPSGFALLPVPIISPHTVEYGAPNPHEFGHVRAPGLDYFERYRKVFRKVTVRSSSDFDEHYQLHVYEDRTRYPNAISPHRLPMPGDRHKDYVPICFV
jgi:predicted SAM-dependent methyltransferase